MQPPPPFEMPGGAPRKKKSALPWIIIGGVLVCCIGPIAVLGGGGLYAYKQFAPIGECKIQFSAIGSGLGKYVAANGGKLPDAKTWQSDIAKYYDESIPSKDETGPFQIPRGNETFGCGPGAKTAVTFNAAYSGKTLAEIKDPQAIIVFESSDAPGLNLSGPYKDPGKAASPKMAGTPRGWFAVNATLSDVLVMDGRQTSSGGSNFRTRSRSGSNE